MAESVLVNFLKFAKKVNASDLHLKVGVPPMFRVDGKLMPLKNSRSLTNEEITKIAHSIMNAEQKVKFDKYYEVDLALGIQNLGRFRVNIYKEKGVISAAFRIVPHGVRSIKELNLPKRVETLAMYERGLILVTGTTGSGKSTTMAAMLEAINKRKTSHIITIEDPIEFILGDKKSIISQREAGSDTISFSAGLKSALRQDPDVIMVGEMRDFETIETAIMAAETGHLVMSTLHTLDATETVNRVVAVFPPYQQKQIRFQLATVLAGIISMRLMPRADGGGRVPAVEVLINTGFIRECILDKDRTKEIPVSIAKGHSTYGMQTFDQSLMSLYRKGLITYKEALKQSSNPDDLELRLKGISSTAGDQIWEDFDKVEGKGVKEEGIEVEYESY